MENQNNILLDIIKSGNVNQVKEKLFNEYQSKTELISKKILEIQKLLFKVDPLELMNYLTSTNYFSSVMMGSEIEYSQEQILQDRAVEYVQSLLVSTTIDSYRISDDKERKEVYFHAIQEKTIELYQDVQGWYYYWSSYAEKELNMNQDDINYIVESQMFSLVRGKRYQFQEEDYLTSLILPLDDLIRSKYKISAIDVVEGLLNIEKSLTQGRGKALNGLQDLMEKYAERDISSSIEIRNQGTDLFNKLLGTGTNDVKEITNWPDKFIEDFSLSLGEATGFTHEQYSYWPVLSLPIERKPFIKLNDRYYCFSYYSLFDNIYRILQKNLSGSRQSKDYWEQTQKETSENAVVLLFKEMLPGCSIYRDNYYPEKESLRRMNENDILIEYENSLLIIEVKAGSFSPVPALLNAKSHLKSYKNLVEKADQQCQRTVSYLQRKVSSTIYDKEKNIKTTLSMNKYDYTYTLCITVDDFNEFAAKAEKLNQINITLGTIVMSIDDLRTYKDYFDSPLIFLNFLENRKNATKISALRLTDELDHLGMYIKHNMYPLTFKDEKNNSRIQAFGYRQELDDYFMSIWTDTINKKPKREIEEFISNLLSLVDSKKLDNKLVFSNLLLDFSTDGATDFVNNVSNMYGRQCALNRMIAGISAGTGVRYVLFLEQPKIQKMSITQQRKYCDGMLAYGDYSELIMIYLVSNDNFEIIDLQFEVRKRSDISSSKMGNLIEYGKETFGTRKASMLKSMKKNKIGRNDRCPCGSGVKYKKCCGG
ncbi:SEC-C metal-binding domain-containing protein [Latilactobacillus sakei]|uniref:YecA family protein n=1 Tax=Latilactobacillus sakei TaxID=1599 RepID=UPI003F533918